MFFLKTYIFCFIWSEIAIRKGSLSTTWNVDCSTLQTSRPNHPTTYTDTHTKTKTTVSPCIHPFILSTTFTLSLFHKNEPSITIAIHDNHPSINHALHGPLSMAFVHAHMTLPLLAHNGMHLHAYRLPTTTLQRDIHACMHACIEMTTSSHPLNVLMSIFGGGGGGGWWYWPQSRYSS